MSVSLEAAACARPIVAADMPGCREIVRDGENGFLIPEADVPARCAALSRLLGDRALWLRMDEAGRRLVVGEFANGSVISATLAFYARALSACPASKVAASEQVG